MKWIDLNIEELRDFDVILISGPQRSGTTFAGHALAKLLGYWFIDELIYDVNDVEKFDNICRMKKVVIQCPGMVHRLSDYSQFAALVYMIRNVDDIIASQERIGWDWEEYEFEKLEGMNLESDIIAEAKYELLPFFRSIFKLLIELEYDSMNVAEGFVPKEDRKNFLNKQIKIINDEE